MAVGTYVYYPTGGIVSGATTFSSTVTLPNTGTSFNNGSQINSLSNGTLQVQDSAATTGALQLGPTSTGVALNVTGTNLLTVGGALTIDYAFNSQQLSPTYPIYRLGGNSLSGLGASAATNAILFTNGVPALTLDASQNATFPNATIDAAGGSLVPSQINTETMYWSDDFMASNGTFNYTLSGNYDNNINHVLSAILPSTMGVLQTWTSSATQGGGASGGTEIPVIKSSAITYQWRSLFYLPTASTATNRYIAYIGAINSNTATSGYVPYGGAYIQYSDNVNGGSWVLGSAVGGTQTTANSTVAATNGWHKLTITLANGVFTYVLDGVTLGTVTDANITTTGPNTAWAQSFGAVIVPDGTNWTAQQYLTVDRADFYVTGLSR